MENDQIDPQDLKILEGLADAVARGLMLPIDALKDGLRPGRLRGAHPGHEGSGPGTRPGIREAARMKALALVAVLAFALGVILRDVGQDWRDAHFMLVLERATEACERTGRVLAIEGGEPVCVRKVQEIKR